MVSRESGDQLADAPGNGNKPGHKLDQINKAGEFLIGYSVMQPVADKEGDDHERQGVRWLSQVLSCNMQNKNPIEVEMVLVTIQTATMVARKVPCPSCGSGIDIDKRRSHGKHARKTAPIPSDTYVQVWAFPDSFCIAIRRISRPLTKATRLL